MLKVSDWCFVGAICLILNVIVAFTIHFQAFNDVETTPNKRELFIQKVTRKVNFFMKPPMHSQRHLPSLVKIQKSENAFRKSRILHRTEKLTMDRHNNNNINMPKAELENFYSIVLNHKPTKLLPNAKRRNHEILNSTKLKKKGEEQYFLSHNLKDSEMRFNQFSENAKNNSKYIDSVLVSAEEFRNNPFIKTGNSLIDLYGNNDFRGEGEMGREVLLKEEEVEKGKGLLEKYNIHVLGSDRIALNRLIPDSRMHGYVELILPYE